VYRTLTFVFGTCLFLLHFQIPATAADPASQTIKRYVHPVLVTEMTRYDTDDPAIWINRDQPEKSLVLGTDKNRDGALYVYDLKGRIIKDKVVRNLQRPNNVDVEYGLDLGGKKIDIAVVTERLTHRLRIFRLPDMQPIDQGGIEVFVDEPTEDFRSPMGIALYKRPDDGAVFAIVGRKSGPDKGYRWQYRLEDNGFGRVRGVLERKFGAFSGEKEIEAIAVDDASGYVYYCDENAGIRKYHADPRKGSEELALFGTDNFTEDREGIAIYPIDERRGYILVSDQQANRFNIYSREGKPGSPHDHTLLTSVNTVTNECDGCEVTPTPLGDKFPHGLFVAMSDNKTFQFYDWDDVIEGYLKDKKD
jgi:3-phytase